MRGGGEILTCPELLGRRACIGKHADVGRIAHGQAVPPGHYGQSHSVRRTESMGNRERKGGKMQVDVVIIIEGW